MAVEPEAVYHTPQAETYKQYVRENWDKLAPWEQRQAEQFLAASESAADRPVGALTAPSSRQPFLNDDSKPNEHPELYWTIRIGWVCAGATLVSPFLFGMLGVFFGAYNFWRGEEEKGLMQIGLSLLIFVVMVIFLMATFDLFGKFVPGPDYLVT